VPRKRGKAIASLSVMEMSIDLARSPLWLDRDDTSCPEREERRRMLSIITIDIKDKGLVRQQGCKKALPFIQELSGKKCHVSSLDKPVFACLPHLHNHRLDWYTAGRL